MLLPRILERLVYHLGLILCGFYTVCLSVLLVLSISGKKLGADIPRFPNPDFFGLLVLLFIMLLNTSYLFTRKTGRFRTVVIGVDYLLGAVSIPLIIPGFPTTIHLTPDMAHVGMVWIIMAASFGFLILLKDRQQKPVAILNNIES